MLGAVSGVGWRRGRERRALLPTYLSTYLPYQHDGGGREGAVTLIMRLDVPYMGDQVWLITSRHTEPDLSLEYSDDVRTACHHTAGAVVGC